MCQLDEAQGIKASGFPKALGSKGLEQVPEPTLLALVPVSKLSSH